MLIGKKWTLGLILIVLAVALVTSPVLAEEEEGPELDDIMEEMQEALELTEEQEPEVEKAMLAYMTNLNETQAKYEDQEEFSRRSSGRNMKR
jgi:hypothetical protein